MDARAWDQRYGASESVWGRSANVFVVRYLEGLQPGDAIDLGAGEGRNSVWLARRGWRVTAVDFSAVGLRRAEAAAREEGLEIDTVVAPAESFVPADRVDLVLLAYLQVAPALRTSILQRVAGWLRTGGRVLVVAHDVANVTGGWGGPTDPGVCYEPAAAVADLRGIRIDFAATVAREVPGAPRPALDTVVWGQREG